MTRKERKERAAFIRGMKGVWTEEELLAAHSKGKLYVNHMGQLSELTERDILLQKIQNRNMVIGLLVLILVSALLIHWF